MFTGFHARAHTHGIYSARSATQSAMSFHYRSMECINTHTQIDSIIMHYYSCLVIHSKVKLTHTETQHPCTHRDARTHTRTHTHTHTIYLLIPCLLYVYSLYLCTAVKEMPAAKRCQSLTYLAAAAAPPAWPPLCADWQ